MVPDVFEIGFHRPMMGPLVGHKNIQFPAGVVAAITAEVKMSVPGALPECALLYKVIGIVAAAAVTVGCSACTAKETAGTAFLGFHRRTFFNDERSRRPGWAIASGQPEGQVCYHNASALALKVCFRHS